MTGGASEKFRRELDKKIRDPYENITPESEEFMGGRAMTNKFSASAALSWSEINYHTLDCRSFLLHLKYNR